MTTGMVLWNVGECILSLWQLSVAHHGMLLLLKPLYTVSSASVGTHQQSR